VKETYFVCDLEDFNFPHPEVFSTREDRLPVQSPVVDVRAANSNVPAGVCVALIGKINVTKAWTARGMRIYCMLFLGHQCKFSRRDVLWTFQCEKKTLQAIVAFGLETWLRLH
jgi:hypothetical protein